MSDQLELKYQFYSYWHTGGGRGSGAGADASVEKNRHGLPYLGGKTIKGLYRDAVSRMDEWGHLEDATAVLSEFYSSSPPASDILVEFLFGRRLNSDNEDRRGFHNGVLRFFDATLHNDVSEWITARDTANENTMARESLFTTLQSTAIDIDTGAAQKHSLRSHEVTVPLTLYSRVKLITNDAAEIELANDLEWKSLIKCCAPLLRHIGAGRNRGLGRVDITEGVSQ